MNHLRYECHGTWYISPTATKTREPLAKIPRFEGLSSGKMDFEDFQELIQMF
jgi:hypothetical protein